jgi:hypothetical protein
MASDPEPVHFIPGYQAMLNGFNLKTAAFVAEAIFESGSRSNILDDYDPGSPHEVAIPDGTQVFIEGDSFAEHTKTMMSNESDYDTAYSVSVSGKVKGISFSASAGSDLAFHQNLFSHKDSTYDLQFFRSHAYKMRRDTAGPVSSRVTTALGKLPKTFDPANPDQFFAFFDIYGTHYLTTGDFGGTFLSVTEIDHETFTTITETKLKVYLDAAYDGVVGSGSLDFQAAYSDDENLKQVASHLHVKNSNIGGAFITDTVKYAASVWKLPVLLIGQAAPDGDHVSAPDLTPLSSLATDAGVAAAMDAALAAYLPKTAAPGDVFFNAAGASSVVINAVQPVTADGIVTVRVNQSTDGDAGELIGSADGDANPSQERAAASQHTFGERGIAINSGCLTLLVRKGENYRIDLINNYGTPTAEGVLFPFAQNILGTWKPVADGSFEAQTSGFLCSLADFSQDGNRGYIQATQTLDGAEALIGAASVHGYVKFDAWIRKTSFVVPVAKGETVTVTSTPTYGAPIFKSWWLDLNPQVVMDKPSKRDAGEKYTAATAGFFFGVVYCEGPEFLVPTGGVDLQVAADETFTNPLQRSAFGGVGESTLGQPRLYPYASALVPVMANQVYRGVVEGMEVIREGMMQLSLWWVGVAMKQ